MKQAATKSVVLLGALFAVSLSAYGHGGDPSKIHACVNTRTGALRIVGATESCRIAEAPLDWSQAASITTRIVTDSLMVPGDVPEPASVSVFCEADEWLTGGGFDQTSDFAVALDILRSSPAIDGTGLANGWTARARNRTNQDQVLQVFALCASSAP